MTQGQLVEAIREIRASLCEQSPRPMNFSEAAVYLSLSRSRLYYLTSQGLIPHYKPTGKKIYFLKSDLDKFLLSRRIASREEIAEAARQ